MIIYGKYDVEKFRTTVGATCGRLPIHSEQKMGEHSSPLRYDIKFNLLTTANRYIIYVLITTAAASHRPTQLDVNSH